MKTKLGNLNALIFDMDGTIINTEPIHHQALSEIIKRYHPESVASELLALHYGKSDPEIHALLLKDDLSLTSFLTEKNSHLRESLAKLREEELQQLVTPGLYPFLHFLKEKKVQTAIVTASEEEVLKIVLRAMKLENFFDLKFSRASTHLSKPSPSPYLKAMRDLFVRHNETLIFEDSPTGVEAASLSAAHVIRITWALPEFKNIENVQTAQNFDSEAIRQLFMAP